MNTAERVALIERNAAEVIGRDELPALLDSGVTLQHYIGFEISGLVHLGTGLVSMAKINDLLDAGVRCRVFLADWHTWINDKLGGDRDAIRHMAAGYFKEAMLASLSCLRADTSGLEFVLATALYNENPDYWATVIDVSKHTTLARMQRSITILGRDEQESVDFAKLIYPAMQAADIFAQHVHIAHAGMDQRKAHVIARDVALKLRMSPLFGADGTRVKPVALHHALILGLKRPPVWPVPAESVADVFASMKMTKSDPTTAVYVHDSPDTIRDKVKRAFCPPEAVDFNPVMDWIDKLVFRIAGGPFRIERTPANGGTMVCDTFDEVASAYMSGALHPMDAKAALSQRLIDLLEPARAHFDREPMRGMLVDAERLVQRARA